MRFIPKQRLKFDYLTADGPASLLFQGTEAHFKRLNNWKLAVVMAMPATGLAYYMMALTYPWVYGMLCLPILHNVWDAIRLKTHLKREVYKLWLYKNGD